MADTGWLDHGTFFNDDYLGGAAWADLTDAVSENAAYASADVVGEDDTDYIRGQNIDEAIPAGATINGIEFRFKGYHGGVPLAFLTVLYLHKAGTIAGANKAVALLVPGSNAWSGLRGGPTDMWSSGYDIDDVKDPTFGVKFAIGSSDTQTLYVDAVQLKIYYDVPSTEGPLPAFRRPV